MESKHNEKSGLKKSFVMGKMKCKAPTCFRVILLPIKSICKLVNVLKLDVWVINGEEISSKQKLSIIYAGKKENRYFLIKSAFDSSYRENYIGKTWLWKILSTVKKKGYDGSLMVIEVPRPFCIFFDKKTCFHIPCWVCGEIDISADISALIKKNRSFKSDRNKIQKNKLNFEVTNDPQQFHTFYHEMYVPHVNKAHANRAVITDYDSMKKEFKNCDLLLINKEKECVAGMLLAYPKNAARFWSLGVKDGNSDYIKDGAIGALIYFSIHYLKGKGYKKVDFGLSRAFLNDGALQFKKKRSMQLVNKSKVGFQIMPLSKTAGVKGFFLNNPFIYMDKMKFNGAVFVETDQSFSKEDFEKIYKEYYLKGMSRLILYRFGEVASRTPEMVPTEFNDKMTICSAERLF